MSQNQHDRVCVSVWDKEAAEVYNPSLKGVRKAPSSVWDISVKMSKEMAVLADGSEFIGCPGIRSSLSPVLTPVFIFKGPRSMETSQRSGLNLKNELFVGRKYLPGTGGDLCGLRAEHLIHFLKTPVGSSLFSPAALAQDGEAQVEYLKSSRDKNAALYDLAHLNARGRYDGGAARSP